MKKLLKFVAILVVVLIIAVVAAVIFVPKSVILNQVLAQVERQSGRSVSVGEDVALSFYPQLSLTANDLRVGNAPWATDPQMITAQRVRFGLQTMPLLRGEVIAETIELIRPVVSLETGADGAGNWVLDPSGDDAETGDAAHEADAFALPHFKNIHIEEGVLRYADQGAVTTVEALTLDLGWPSYEGALTARLRPA